MEFLSSSYSLLPQGPGVYRFLDEQNNVLYVGKAKNLKNRVSSYFGKTAALYPKTRLLVSKTKKIKITIVESEIESLLLEANTIKKYNPAYNIRLTDGKSYPLIRITKTNIYPKVLIARRMEDKHSVYFGPFPNASALKLVLKTIRRIFPYESVLNHPKKPCLYYHLDLCPCVEVFDSEDTKKMYKKTIQRIIKFLNGDLESVVKDLEKERNSLSKQERFEKAKQIQQKIDAIHLITNPAHTPFEYQINPNLSVDLRRQELQELAAHLQKTGIMVKNLSKIECYDISNIQGTHSVASLVVFINGEKNTSLYRRFKMRYQKEGIPNDFAAMEEVLERRLKHTEWNYPDLIVVDGGKGQITSALKALMKYNLSIPVIGLAK